MILLGYLLRSVLVRLGLVLPALAAIYLAFDLGDEGRRLAAHVGWTAVVRASLLHLPLVVVQIVPAAVLLAALLAVGSLRRRGELEAMAMAGAGPLRLGAPLLIVGACAALLALLLDELVVPSCERSADLLYRHRRASALTGQRAPSRWAAHGAWFLHQQGGEVLALQLDARFRIAQRVEGRLGQHGELRGASAVRFAPDGTLVRSLPDEFALHRGASEGREQGELRLHRGAPCGSPPTAPSCAPMVASRAEAQSAGASLPAALALLAARERPRAEAQSFAHLRRTLAGLEETGQTTPPEELVLHTKLAFPLLNLVVALLAWPAALRRDRRAGSAELLAGLGQLFFLWALLASGWTAGRVGWLSPAAAVWAPTAAGGVLGGMLLLRALRS